MDVGLSDSARELASEVSSLEGSPRSALTEYVVLTAVDVTGRLESVTATDEVTIWTRQRPAATH